MSTLIRQLLSNRFRVQDRIGQGAMGEVFIATDEVLGRQVAIKVLKSELALEPKFLDCFRREARIIAQLSSNPHVVTIYDVGMTDDQCPFLVTELLNGHPLSEELCSSHRPSRTWVIDVGVQIAYALADAHDRGVEAVNSVSVPHDPREQTSSRYGVRGPASLQHHSISVEGPLRPPAPGVVSTIIDEKICAHHFPKNV